MRIDIDYMKWMLEKIQNHDDVQFTWDLFDIREISKDTPQEFKNLVFHAEILKDMNLLEPVGNFNESIGFKRDGSGNIHTSIIPLRLTSDGHDFAVAISKKGVIERIKSSFKELGPRELVSAVFHFGKQIFSEGLN